VGKNGIFLMPSNGKNHHELFPTPNILSWKAIYVIEDANSKRTYISTNKTNYNFILENKCDMLFLMNKT